MATPGTTDQQPAAAATATATATATTAAADTPAESPLLYNGTEPWIHTVCLAAAVLGPIGLFLPPRRLGLRALLLAGGTAIGTNQLVYDYTGQTIPGRMQARAEAMGAGFELPEAARQRQAAMRAERERRQRLAAAAAQQEAAAQNPAAQQQPPPPPTPDWVAERQRKEREVLEAGGGYWELIVGQIHEVWADLRGKGK